MLVPGKVVESIEDMTENIVNLEQDFIKKPFNVSSETLVENGDLNNNNLITPLGNARVRVVVT